LYLIGLGEIDAPGTVRFGDEDVLCSIKPGLDNAASIEWQDDTNVPCLKKTVHTGRGQSAFKMKYRFDCARILK